MTIASGTSAPKSSVKKVLIRGAGEAVKTGDTVVADNYARTWDSDKPFDNSFVSGSIPSTLPQGTKQLIPGLDSALVGVPVGSRVLLILPPADAFGNAGQPKAGIKPTDTLVFVIDVVADLSPNADITGKPISTGGGKLPTVTGPAGSEPKIAIPKTAAPTTLSATTLIQGAGDVVKAGDLLVTQYTGVVWRDGTTFDSSWKRHAPAGFPIGVGQVIPGWDKTLVGEKVGSRILIVVPPDEGYGPQGGQPDAGIKADDTLVFVVDIVAAYPARA